MNRRQLLVVGGIIVLGLLLAFPLTWKFDNPADPQARPSVRPLGGRSEVRRTDDSGQDWVITRAEGRPAVDANGAPLKPTIVVKTDVFRAGGHNVLIGLVLQDRDGQRYQPAVTKGGVRQPAPKLRIVDEAGQVLLDDSFQYG